MEPKAEALLLRFRPSPRLVQHELARNYDNLNPALFLEYPLLFGQICIAH
jgi:hypothetical protein